MESGWLGLDRNVWGLKLLASGIYFEHMRIHPEPVFQKPEINAKQITQKMVSKNSMLKVIIDKNLPKSRCDQPDAVVLMNID